MQAKFLPHFLSAQADRRFNIFTKSMPESTKLRPGRPTEIRFPLLRKSILSAQKPSEASGKFISRLKTYTSKLEIQLFTQFIHFSDSRPEEISPQSSLFQITPAGFVPGRRPRIPDKAPPLPHKLRKSKSSPDFPDMSHFYITFVL